MSNVNTLDADTVVVIPAYNERNTLPRTLKSLADNPAHFLCKTLVLCVVNNRAPDRTPASVLHSNQDTLEFLRDVAGNPNSPVRVSFVDASSPGRELPAKGGVGLARKIGMDWALHILAEAEQDRATIVCLDADTQVDRDYLPAIHAWRRGRDAWGAVLRYAHPMEEDEKLNWGITQYELFLRYHVLGLRYARSPYAFHTVGSCMACTAQAYAVVRGMSKLQAGEDFYFLEKLAKTGPIHGIEDTVVQPSPRPSDRVPFGTGARMQQFLEQPEETYTVYRPECYRVVRAWIAAVQPDATDLELIHLAERIHPALRAFLEQVQFSLVWQRIQSNAADDRTIMGQYHRWFGAFMTLKLIHHLRDTVFAPVPLEEALQYAEWVPSGWFGMSAALARVREVDIMKEPSGLGRGARNGFPE